MAETGEFDEAEWQTLRQLPLVVAAVISAVDYSTISEGREYKAFTEFLKKAGAKRRKSPFVAAILDEVVEADHDTFQKHCTTVSSAMSGEKPVENALKQVKEAGLLIDARLGKKDARPYKEFILDVALAVARAHKESALPFASPVSKVEDFHIRRIETALGI
ncbi:MAG: hypothetical protein KAH11_07760 [Rhodospirillales bacterium]|nr:hypothetical protein [Rhodospirillales bacterium]